MKRKVAFIYEKKGFLLLESLLVVSILTIGITLIINSLSSSTKAFTMTGSYIDAILLTENTLDATIRESVKNGGTLININSFHVSDQTYEYSVKSHISPYLLDVWKHQTETKPLKEITITTEWDAGRNNNYLKISTLVFDGVKIRH